MDVLSIWESAAYLANHLPQRNQRAWYGYLKQNPVHWKIQNGVKINWRLTTDSKVVYTPSALNAFIAAHQFK